MLRDLAHFARHAPATIRLLATMEQSELYDLLMRRWDEAGLGEKRRALVADLRGRVLEIGAGTGLMFESYPAGVTVTAIEPEASFRALAEAAAPSAPVPVEVVDAVGEALPFDDASFDAVVIALVLCSVRSVEQVLDEARRVLVPGGELRLIEHVRSESFVAGTLMRAANPLWLLLNRQGCNMHRTIEPALKAAGFELQEVERLKYFVPGLPSFPLRWIKALAPGPRAAAGSTSGR